MARSLERLFTDAEPGDPSGSLMFVDANLYLPGDLFMVLDKTSMAASLEARVPLLDHRLVEKVAALPGEVRMPDGDLKWLLRRVLRGHVPDEILDRPKQGFSRPILRWLEGPLGGAGGGLLSDRDGRVRSLLGERALDRWLHPGAVPDDLRTLRTWSLLVLEL